MGLILSACGAAPSPAPTATDAPAAAGLVLGCASIEAPECQFVAEHVAAALPPARGRPFAIEITLFGCPNPGAPCPRTLGVRQGRAVAEYVDGGEPIEMSLAGQPQAPRIAIEQGAWSGLIVPSSPRVLGQGPFPFDVGHCGLSHVIDFDGSFWLPVGQVDGDASVVIKRERGQILLVGPNLAEYRGAGGFVARLARFPGPKHFWLCS